VTVFSGTRQTCLERRRPNSRLESGIRLNDARRLSRLLGCPPMSFGSATKSWIPFSRSSATAFPSLLSLLTRSLVSRAAIFSFNHSVKLIFDRPRQSFGQSPSSVSANISSNLSDDPSANPHPNSSAKLSAYLRDSVKSF
jgi:hypothetical protein